MDAGRHARDDGDVVGIGYGWHCAFCRNVEAVLNPAGHRWQDALFESGGEVFGIEAIDANYDGGAGRDGVGFVVKGDCGSDLVGHLDNC